jgi:hypothetical protein
MALGKWERHSYAQTAPSGNTSAAVGVAADRCGREPNHTRLAADREASRAYFVTGTQRGTQGTQGHAARNGSHDAAASKPARAATGRGVGAALRCHAKVLIIAAKVRTKAAKLLTIAAKVLIIAAGRSATRAAAARRNRLRCVAGCRTKARAWRVRYAVISSRTSSSESGTSLQCRTQKHKPHEEKCRAFCFRSFFGDVARKGAIPCTYAANVSPRADVGGRVPAQMWATSGGRQAAPGRQSADPTSSAKLAAQALRRGTAVGLPQAVGDGFRPVNGCPFLTAARGGDYQRRGSPARASASAT